jgi:FkbM family methyltransferase
VHHHNGLRMIDTALRAVPLAAFLPMRRAVATLPRRHPLRLGSTLVLKRVARAHRAVLSSRLREIRPLDEPGLSFEPSDSMVMDAVFWFGVRGYEGSVSRVWTELCREARSVLEIGANVGLFSVLGGRVCRGRYLAVEPVPGNVRVLRANLRRNAIAGVTVLEAAVIPDAEPRDVALNVPEEGREQPVGAHLTTDVEVSGRSTRATLVVPGKPVRALAEGCDVIKIDAEGIEAALLGRLRDLLLATRPTLLIEVLPEAAGLGTLLARLAEDAGYGIHVLPEYGSDRIVSVPAAAFTAATPRRHNAKDVLLSVSLPLALAG